MSIRSPLPTSALQFKGTLLALVLFVGIWAEPSLSTDLGSLSQSSMAAAARSFDEEIYNTTLIRCQRTLQTNGQASRLASIWQGFNIQVAKASASEGVMVLGLNTQAIANTIQNKGISTLLAATLASAGFQAALETCYADDSVSKKTYIAGLIVSEVAGRVVVGGVMVAGGYIASRVFGALYTFSPVLAEVVLLGITISANAQTYASIRSELGARNQKEEEQARARCLEAVRPQIERTEQNQNFLNLQIRQLQLRTIILTDPEEVRKKLTALKRLLELREQVWRDLNNLAKCAPVKE